MIYSAKSAVSGAGIAEDQESAGALRKAFADVRTPSFLTNGVNAIVIE